jgi:DNA-binding transcriptional LysR family regulator
MLDLRQFHYFVVVVEEGQMTRAAARLHIAQPALSQAIGKLESELGVQLFERHARGVSPTEAGEAFFEKAAAALIAVEEAEEALDPWLLSAPRLIVGFSHSVGDIARGLLRPYMLAWPDVEVQTRHLAPPERLVELKRGGVDVELLYPPPREPELIERVVSVSPRYVVLSESHRLAGERSLVFAQIEGETLPARHPSVAKELAEDAWLSSYRDTPPRLSESAPTSLDELWTLVSLGRAVAILPEFAVPRMQGDGVRAIPLVDVDPLEVCLALRREDVRPVVRDLLSTIDASIRSREGHSPSYLPRWQPASHSRHQSGSRPVRTTT